MFNTESFLNTQFSDANATRREPIPVGEYQATVETLKPEVTQNGSPLIRVTWRIQSFDNDEINNRLVDQTIWLDVTANGALDMGKGKNVGLGRLREAVGQNKPGQPWQPGMLLGAQATVLISHRPDKEDPAILHDQVKSVTKSQ